MKRNPRKVKWTKSFRKLAGKELAEVRGACLASAHHVWPGQLVCAHACASRLLASVYAYTEAHERCDVQCRPHIIVIEFGRLFFCMHIQAWTSGSGSGSVKPCEVQLHLLPNMSQRQCCCMQDATFEMERKRNRPEKYNRELVHKTIKGVEKVSAVCPWLTHLTRLLVIKPGVEDCDAILIL